jgi:hypothetical protein
LIPNCRSLIVYAFSNPRLTESSNASAASRSASAAADGPPRIDNATGPLELRAMVTAHGTEADIADTADSEYSTGVQERKRAREKHHFQKDEPDP